MVIREPKALGAGRRGRRVHTRAHTHAHTRTHSPIHAPVSGSRGLFDRCGYRSTERGSDFPGVALEVEPGLPVATSPFPVTSGHVVPGPVALGSEGLHLPGLHQGTGLSLQQCIRASALSVPSKPS